MGGHTDIWTPDMYLSEKLRQDENHRTLFFGTFGVTYLKTGMASY